MSLDLKHTDYSQSTFEELLQDDFFLSSMKQPTEETEAFWSDFERSKPANLDDFKAAKVCIVAIAEGQNSLSEEEATELWNRINTTNTSRTRRKNYFLMGMSIAASVVILLGSLFFLRNLQGNDDLDIASFALQAKITLPKSDETLLILSERKVLSMKEKDAVITYDSTEINTSQEKVAKENVASYNQLVTPRGKRSVLTFSDGSKVWVNAGTRVIYPAEFEKEKREIYVDGEIYIEVARDESRPFYVKTKNMNVRVLGTKFNVTAYESEPMQSVVLVSGSVQVETEKTPEVVLAPSQMFTTSKGKDQVEQVNVDRYTSWVDGLYYFESEDLGIVLTRLSTYYGLNLIFDPALTHIKCSGKIDLKDRFETVLDGLTFLAPISFVYDEQSKTYRIEKKK